MLFSMTLFFIKNIDAALPAFHHQLHNSVCAFFEALRLA
jgi:hypothetical protein